MDCSSQIELSLLIHEAEGRPWWQAEVEDRRSPWFEDLENHDPRERFGIRLCQEARQCHGRGAAAQGLGVDHHGDAIARGADEQLERGARPVERADDGVPEADDGPAFQRRAFGEHLCHFEDGKGTIR